MNTENKNIGAENHTIRKIKEYTFAIALLVLSVPLGIAWGSREKLLANYSENTLIGFILLTTGIFYFYIWWSTKQMDEFEKLRHYRACSYALAAGFLTFPWYAFSLMGITEVANPVAVYCFMLFAYMVRFYKK